MKKTNYLSIAAILIVLLFLSEINVYADVPSSPVAVGGALLLFIGLIVGLIALFAWLIIRATKK